MSLLEVHDLAVRYGASQALFDVSLTLDKGEVLALLGRNGMGKTTTIKAITGMLPKLGGTVLFEGCDVTRLRSHKVARKGVGLVPEGRRIFANLTVHENLTAAARPGHWGFSRVAELFPRLAERKDQSAATLSGGEQQMLAIGRALMTNPKLLILDEATEGLAPIVRQEIWAAITALKAQTAMSILLVDKSLGELGRIADSAVILQRGSSVWSGRFEALSDEITSQYVGV
jgi:branched-chain amino acid transport system ATP-binding protein